jgi:hypothetical protein
MISPYDVELAVLPFDRVRCERVQCTNGGAALYAAVLLSRKRYRDVCTLRTIEYIVFEWANRPIERGWTCFRYAANEFDLECGKFDPHAAQFCAGAALVRAAVEVFGETQARSIDDSSLETIAAR